MVSYQENRTDSQVLEQGFATRLSSNSIVDANKIWAVNQWTGHLVRIRGGENDHAVGILIGNSTNQLYVSGISLSIEAEGTVTIYEILSIKGGTVEATAELKETLEAILNVLMQMRDGLKLMGYLPN